MLKGAMFAICAAVIIPVLDSSISTKGKGSDTGVCENPSYTSVVQEQSREKRSTSTRVSKCNPSGFQRPRINLQCDPGSTIRVIKGVCVPVPDCDSYNVSLDSLCENSNRTAQWNTVCGTTNYCQISGDCGGVQTCSPQGGRAYIYADYECVDPPPVVTETTTAAPTTTTQTPTPEIDRQKGSLYKQIPFRRLTNHMIKVKPGISSAIRCGAECNNLDDCVSFNLGSNGVCELNNRMVDRDDLMEGRFVHDDGFKYYQKV